MKESAYFINVGRGPIVVEEDLAKALEEGQIRAAGLDVMRVEPLPMDSPLLKIPLIIFILYFNWERVSLNP